MIEIKGRLMGPCRRVETETRGVEGLAQNRRERRGLARLRAEDRIDEILSRLAVGEAIGSNGDEALGRREIEEELLDELAELERIILRGVGPDGLLTRTAAGGRARWTEGAKT